MQRWRKVLQEAISCWSDHNASTLAAALAFYTVFSLAPVLLVVVALAGAAFGAEAVRGQIHQQFQELMGAQAAGFVEQVLRSAAQPRSGRIATIVGALTLVFGASGVFVQLQDSLNIVWGVKPKPGAILTTLLRKRLLSFAVLLGIGFLLTVSLVLSIAVSGLGTFLEEHLGLPASLLQAANLLISLLLVTLLFGLIYRLLPDVELSWGDVALGSIVTSLLFAVGKELIGLYLGHTSVASAYGAAGSMAIVLLWIYYSSLIFLFGAELTRIRSHQYRQETAQPSPEPEAGAEKCEEETDEETSPGNAPRGTAPTPAQRQAVRS
ncbi:MAG: YihY/virulence factor BrkB family protein [Acidobacteriota bacterium]|nr:YihY/virulence factor BrkB family protein [Acidobacteriota bacterium]